MSEENKKNSKRLKNYHFIILSCLLCMIFIINSNRVNKGRFLDKLNQVKKGLYENIKTLRNLQDISIDYTTQVCSKASDDLNEYYKTGDKSKIDIDSDEITCEDKDKPYMQNLIAAVRSINGDDDNGEGKSIQETGIDYGMRFIPMLIFALFGLLGIFGWLICCVCACCNCCCCCCCCKKPECKKVCFIITYAFYAVVVGVSIFGLAVTSKAFRGLNDTGCAFLQFFDQVLEGEIDQSKIPRWSGANNIKNILLHLKDYIENSGETAYNNIYRKFDSLNQADEAFLSYMKSSSNSLYINNKIVDYLKPYENSFYNGKYILDIVHSYGKDLGNSFTKGSILYNWKEEYNLIGGNAKNYINSAYNAFDDILNNNIHKVVEKLDDGANNINKIIKPFKELNENMGQIFDGMSNIGEDYGKMSLHSIFSTLMVLNLILAGFILLTCFCSMKQCTSCCCCRCLFKCAIHLSWNILALMMIFSFLFGSLIGILGIFGGDMMSLVSYILSKENFNNENDPLLIDKLGDARKYLNTFIHGNGSISGQLDLQDSLKSFNDINKVQDNIKAIKDSFSGVNSLHHVYSDTIALLQKKTDFSTDPQLIPVKENYEYDNSKNNISYYELIQKINVDFNNKDEKYQWDYRINENNNNQPCSTEAAHQTVFSVKVCKPHEIIVPLYNSNPGVYDDLKILSDISSDIEGFLTLANKEVNDPQETFIEILKHLDTLYSNYLSQFEPTLNTFDSTIDMLVGEIRPLIKNQEDFFSFLNGQFIKTNVQIILKYLKDAFGKNIFSIGLSLIIAGCALVLSISSTLILLAIINEELNQHIKKENTPGISSSEMRLNNISRFPPQNIFPA